VGKVGKRIVEFVGLVYMCEVRGQNKTEKTNEKHRGHESGMSCPYGYKYLMGINMRRPYGIYGGFQNKLWQDKTQRKKQKAGQGDMIDTWDLKR
jgi:hypothetical protein